MTRVSHVREADKDADGTSLTANRSGAAAKPGDSVSFDSASALAPELGIPVLATVESAVRKVGHTGTVQRATEATEPTEALSRVRDDATLPPTAASRGREQLIMRGEASPPPAAGTIPKPGDSVADAHVQRRTVAEYSNETKAVRPTASASRLLPQNPHAPATGDGKNLPNAESRGLKPPTPGQAQMGPPIFRRQARGAPLLTNRQTAVPPEKKQVSNSSIVGVPSKTSGPASLPDSRALPREQSASGRQHVEGEMVAGSPSPANPVHLTRSKAATEVTQAAAPIPQKIPKQLTNLSQHLAVGSTRNSVTEASVLPSVAKASEQSGPRQSMALARGPDQTDSVGPVLAAKSPIAGSVGGSAAPPLVQRKATALPSPRSKSSNLGSLVEGAARRMDVPALEAADSASSTESMPLSVTPSAAPSANAVWSPLGVRGAAHRMDLPAVEAADSASKTESMPLSVTPSAAANADAVRNQTSGTGPLVSGGLGSSFSPRRPDGSIAHLAKTTAPLVVQRKATAFPLPRSKSSNPGKLAEDAAHRMDSPLGQAAISSSRSESISLSVTPPRTPTANAAWNQPGGAGSSVPGDLGSSLAPRHPDGFIAHRAKPTPSASAMGETPVVHPEPIPSAPLEAQPVVLARKAIQLQSADTPGSAFAPQVLTPVAEAAPRTETDEPITSVVNAAQLPRVPTADSRKAIIERTIDQTIDQAPDARPATLVFPNAPGAVPVLRRATRLPYPRATMGYPAFASAHPLGLPAPGLPGRSEVMHRVWRRTDAASTQPELGHGGTHSPANFAAVQRSAANSAGGGTGVQTPAALPGLPSQGNSASQILPSGDIAQLTNRVYELLVRRLAGEKRQRGL